MEWLSGKFLLDFWRAEYVLTRIFRKESPAGIFLGVVVFVVYQISLLFEELVLSGNFALRVTISDFTLSGHSLRSFIPLRPRARSLQRESRHRNLFGQALREK